MSKLLHCDIETASTLDLRKVGASAYSRHPDTIVTVFAWAFDDGPVSSVTMPKYLPHDVSQHLALDGKFCAWNAAFEWAFVTNYFGLKQMDPRQAVCSMQQALYAGLPAKLEHAGLALGLAQNLQKDVAGHRLMMQMCKPKKDGTFLHDSDPAKLQALEVYCRQDVVAERAVHKLTPELPDYEKAVSLLDRRTNDRGIRLDIPLIHTLRNIAIDETAKLNAECKALTGGYVTSPGTQTQRLLSWLWGQGIKMATVGKEEVQDTLDTAPEAELPVIGTKVLAIRQKVAKSSVKKLQSMLNTVDDDGRVRGTLQYYGAARTGRFSGRLIQPQNFPRPPKGYNPLNAINAIKNGIRNDGLSLFYDEPLSVVSACLRGCLIPSDGKQFLVFDLSQIEARIAAWLAGQNDVVEVFRNGEDVYTYTSDKLGLGSRQAGKIATLGLNFGMGHEAFVDFALTNGLRLTKMESLEIVSSWRDANSFVRQCWWDLDKVAKQAISNPGSVPTVRGIRMRVAKSFGYPCLQIELPSGRWLWYRNPRLVVDPAQPNHTAIVFDGVDQYTKQWSPIRTWGSKLFENCLASGTLVLTDRGWLSIEKVTTGDMLWDGVEWVSHDGLIDQGEKPCLNFNGVWMTPDHKVLADDGWYPAQARPRPAWAGVRLPDGYWRCWNERSAQGAPVGVPLHLRNGSHPDRPCPDRYGEAGLRTLVSELQNPETRRDNTNARHVEAPGIHGVVFDARALPRSEAAGMEELWWPGDHSLPGMGDLMACLLERHGADVEGWTGDRQGRQQRQLRAGKLPLGASSTEYEQQTNNASGQHAENFKEDRYTGKNSVHTLVSKSVYDLKNAGPRARFVVMGDEKPFIVSNCTQAAARDVIVEAALRVIKLSEGIELVLSVHDELLFETNPMPDRAVKTVKGWIETQPQWATGLPIASEGGILTERYGKV